MSPIKKTLQHPKADKEKRSVFCEEIKKHEEKSRPLVFIDESGFAHDMPRLHGYATKGSRCFGSHDWGAKGRTNVIGALLLGTLLTVSLFKENVNTEIFSAWVTHDLIPKLPLQSVVIMDNASFHKGIEMQKAIEDAGHTLLYLPPYSPDFNPIEKKWAQAKAIRRSVGGTIDDLFKGHIL
jgi:transposase